jgi:CBS domain-containing protein
MMLTTVPMIDATESAVTAYALVREAPSGLAIVKHRGRPVGLVDEHHLRGAALRVLLMQDDAAAGDPTVGSCLPRRCIRIPVAAPIDVVADRLLVSATGAAFAVDGGRVVGVITTARLLAALAARSSRSRSSPTRRSVTPSARSRSRSRASRTSTRTFRSPARPSKRWRRRRPSSTPPVRQGWSSWVPVAGADSPASCSDR